MKHKDWLKKLETIIENEREPRDNVRECKRFRTEKNGHWEQHAINLFSDKPRYQFDLVYPVIKSLTSQIEEREFGGRVVEAGGGAASDIADTYEGICRSIQSLSKFPTVLQRAGKRLVADGYDAWMIVTDWADVDGFDQDLLIKPIRDAVNRVFLGPSSEIDHSDRDHGFILTALSSDEYMDQFPKGNKKSIDSPNVNWDESGSKEITIADVFYIKREKKLLHLLNDNSVVDDESYQAAFEMYAAKGIKSLRQRVREIPTCYMRKADGGGWISEEKKTPFSYIPVIEVYGNFEEINGKPNYHGEVLKLMDAQRVYNYAKSREIADGALSPVDKIAVTPDQIEGHEEQNSKLNQSSNPLFIYNPDAQAPPPYKMGGPQPNAQLSVTQQTAAQDIERTSSVFAPAQGQGLSNHSGVAYEILQERSDNGVIEYINALKLGVYQTMKIIIDAIPKVYDTANRQARTMNEDGSTKFVTINEELPDGKIIRDLSQGHYDIVPVAGTPYHSKQRESFQAFMELGKVDPTILQVGKDLMLRASGAPFADQLADRVRPQLIQQGMIPPDQLTDEEREQIEAAQANQKPDPMQQATLQAIMAQVAEMQSKSEERQAKLQLEMLKEQRALRELLLKERKGEAEIQKLQADTIESLSEANDGNMESAAVDRAANRVAQTI